MTRSVMAKRMVETLCEHVRDMVHGCVGLCREVGCCPEELVHRKETASVLSHEVVGETCAERGLALSPWRTDVWQGAEALSARTSFLSGFSSKHVCFSVVRFSAVSLSFHVFVFSFFSVAFVALAHVSWWCWKWAR